MRHGASSSAGPGAGDSRPRGESAARAAGRPTEARSLRRTRSEAFDNLVLDAVDEIDHHWAGDLAGLEFAVEDVPPPGDGLAFGSEIVLDRGVPLGRLYREGLPEIPQPVIVIYRRPIEARALEGDDRADLVFMVVVDLAAEFLGRDADELG